MFSSRSASTINIGSCVQFVCICIHLKFLFGLSMNWNFISIIDTLSINLFRANSSSFKRIFFVFHFAVSSVFSCVSWGSCAHWNGYKHKITESNVESCVQKKRREKRILMWETKEKEWKYLKIKDLFGCSVQTFLFNHSP